LALLVSVTALVIDGGTLMEARRHVQAAADAAAMAGAVDLYTNYLTNQGVDVSGTAKSSALSAASDNSYTNDGVQSTVTVNTSGQNYQGGPNAGKTIPAGYIEVLIQYNASHLFSGVFGAGTSPVCARAVARGRCTPLTFNGLHALNLNLSAALNVSSTGGLTVNGGIQVSSSNSSAIKLSLTSTLTAAQITLNPLTGSLLGSILHLLVGTDGSSPAVVNSPPVPDPLRFLTPPSTTNLITRGTNLSISSGTVDLYPGIYTDGIKISGLGTVVNLHANSDGSPGIYFLDGQNGFQVSGWATVRTAVGETAGIMFYNNWAGMSDSINLNTSGIISLIPPASGLYRGLCIFQKRGSTSTPGPTVTLSAQGAANVTGTIYAAHANVSLATNSSTNVMCGQVIADSVSVSGLANLHINPGTQPTANQRFLGLVE
jgi:hypothetical protein